MLTPPEPVVRSVPNMDCGVRRRAAIPSGTHAAGRGRLRRRPVCWLCPQMAAQGPMGAATIELIATWPTAKRYLQRWPRARQVEKPDDRAHTPLRSKI